MTVTLITQVGPIDPTAARAKAIFAGHGLSQATRHTAPWDELAEGIEEFITAIETLYAPGAPDYVADLDANHMGNGIWSCHYSDGQGDGPDWTANAAWYEQEVPGLMAALGIALNVSGNIYGNSAPHQVP